MEKEAVVSRFTVVIPSLVAVTLLTWISDFGFSDAFAFSLEPCYAKKMTDGMPIPPETEINMAVGHVFRKEDVCIPIQIRNSWDVHLQSFHHSFYDMKAVEYTSGEFWYRKDRKEFVIVTAGPAYSGMDKLVSLSASGEACHHSYDETCDNWSVFGTSHVIPTTVNGSNTGTMVYGFPSTSYQGEPVPEKLDIMPPHWEWRKSAEDYGRPTMVHIDNLALLENNRFDYDDLVKHAQKRWVYDKTILWQNNEKVEDIPTKFSGRIRMEISFDPKCPNNFKIVAPNPGLKYAFSTGSTGKVVINAEAGHFGNMPQDLIDDITWSAPEKDGSRVIYDPPTRKGRTMQITYEGLPEKNSDFGMTTILASVDTGGDCGVLSDTLEVQLFFDRDATNNPTANEPNWYYYWLQTPAGHGAVRNTDVFYKGRDLECGQDPTYLGYHPRVEKRSVPSDPQSQPLMTGQSYIYVCDFHKYDNAYPDHPSTNFLMKGKVNPGATFEGIDTFGVIVKHELTHRQHFADWWNPRGGIPMGGYYDTNNNKSKDHSEPWVDHDKDLIPDDLEEGLGYDPALRDTMSFGADMYDEHHLTYETGEKWTKGSAKKVDWAKPGSQWN